MVSICMEKMDALQLCIHTIMYLCTYCYSFFCAVVHLRMHNNLLVFITKIRLGR